MHYLPTSIIAGIGVGLFPIIDRWSSNYIDELPMLVVRAIFIGLIALFLLITVVNKKDVKKSLRKGGMCLLLALFISPLIGMYVGNFGFYKALYQNRESFAQITLIVFTLPIIMSALASPIIYKDKINIQMVIGIILSLIGISITILYNPNHKVEAH
jgi:drug/metabolite transporter (DMT)-like permease